ncbi:hypothetical protein GF327_01575 [Candidatus Woesearchaeota archaeon]|nr:hypothetical protein [Candidatus Woesearchaeota archaeon]
MKKVKQIYLISIFVILNLSVVTALSVKEKVSTYEIKSGENITFSYQAIDYQGNVAWFIGRKYPNGWTVSPNGITLIEEDSFAIFGINPGPGYSVTLNPPLESGQYVFLNGEWGITDDSGNEADGTFQDIKILVLCEHKETRSCGSDIGECESGTQVCIEGRWKNCSGNIGSTEEICDNLDNDCDGEIDEDVYKECGTEEGVCEIGVQTCINGNWDDCFHEIGPVQEICDNKDNDCDGEIDESCNENSTYKLSTTSKCKGCYSGEILEYYEENLKQFSGPETIHPAHILICHDESKDCESELSKNEARTKALFLLKEIKEGKNFETLANNYSDCPSSVKGGDLGVIFRHYMDKNFTETAFSLDTGEISDVVETEYGFHIIKIYNTSGEYLPSIDKVYPNIKSSVENPCYSFGDRVESSNKYCSKSGNLKLQKPLGESCFFDYECLTNICNNFTCSREKIQLKTNDNEENSTIRFQLLKKIMSNKNFVWICLGISGIAGLVLLIVNWKY